MHIVRLRCGPFSLINELKITLHYRINQSHILKGPYKNKATYYFLVGLGMFHMCSYAFKTTSF